MLKQRSLTLMNCVRLLFSLPRGSGRFGWVSVRDEATAKTLRSLSGLGLILLLLELRAVDVAEYIRRFEDSEHDVACLEGC